MKIKPHLLVLACNLLFFTSNVYSQNGVGVNTNTPKSSFEDNGSFGKKVTTISASTTLDDTDGSIVCNNGATAIVVTLPAANTCAARIYEIKRNVTSTNTVTVSVSGGGTIDGAASFLLTNAGQSVTVFSNGTEWFKRDGSNASTDWTITGNAGTNAGNNFLGTTDNVDMVFRTNGVERARITSATVGSLGVGTTTPFTYGRIAIVSNNNGRGREDDLGIAGFSTSATAGKSNGASPSLNFFSSRGTEASPLNVISGDDIFSILGKGTINGTLNTTTSSIVSEYKGSGTTNLSNLLFTTSGTQKAIIDENGNVGIATATPTSRLHVVGSDAQTSSYPGTLLTNTATSSTSSIDKKGLEVTSIGSWTGTSANNIGIHVSSVSGGTNNYDAIFNGGGRVGIGTNAPGAQLEVERNTTGVNVINVQNTHVAGYSSIDYLNDIGTLSFTTGFGNASSGFPNLGYIASYNKDFIITHLGSTSPDFYLKGTTGNIGINTANPSARLHVLVGSAGVTTSNVGALLENTATSATASINKKGLEVISTGSWSGATANNIGIHVSSVTGGTNNYDAIFNGGGNVGIGTATPTEYLHIFNNTAPFVLLESNGGGGKIMGYKIRTWNGMAANTFVSYGAVDDGASSARAAIYIPNAANNGVTEAVSVLKSSGNMGIGTSSPNSNLEVNGSFAANVNTITTSPTLDATHHIVIVTAGTITLPAAAAGNNKRIYHIANKTAGAITIGNYLNMTSPGTGVSNTIAAGIGISLVSNGTNWIQFR